MAWFSAASSTEVGSSMCLRMRMRKRKVCTTEKLQRKKRDECLKA